MKEKELRELATCSACNKPIGHTKLPLFWRVTVERFGLDHGALQRQQGLAMHMGNAALAAVMGPNEDLAKPVMEPVVLSLCETCALECRTPVGALALQATLERDDD